MARRSGYKPPQNEIDRALAQGRTDAEAGRNRTNPYEKGLVALREAYDRGWKETANRRMTRSFNRALGW